MKSATRKKPALKQLQCPNCGTGLSQYTPGAQTLICPNCGSMVAVGAGDPEITGKSRRLPAPQKPVRIGTTITLKGTEYLIMGRVRYRGWDDEDKWEWDEWLLGADDGRLLWLSYDEKGFSLYTKERFREPFDAKTSRTIKLNDRDHPIKENYPARIIGAEGELTWRAQENERLHVAEGAAYGLRYSIQQTNEEIEVYTGKPINESELAAASNDEKWLKDVKQRMARAGSMSLIAGLCILFALTSCVFSLMVAIVGEEVQRTTVPLRETAQFVDVNFNNPGRPAVVNMRLTSGNLPEDTFADVDVSMIAPDGFESYLFTRSFWRETGYDEGYYDESSYSGSNMFVPLSAGEHQIKIQIDQSTVSQDLAVEMTVRRNIWVAQWFIGYTVVAGLFAVLFYMGAPNVK